MTSDDNYNVFRECLSSAILSRSEKPKTNKRRPKTKRNAGKEVISAADSGLPERVDPEELAEFVDVRIPLSGSVQMLLRDGSK